jgi:hypothetical protein
MRLPSLLLASLFAAACGGSDSPATEETKPSTTEPAPAAEADPPATAVPADPATGGTEPVAEAAPVDPAAPPAAITVAVQNLNRGPSGPSKPLALTATSGTNQITVHFDNLVTYCAPEPSFTAAVEGEVLTLTLVKPNPVSRCFAPFALDAVVSLPGRNNVRKVEIAREDGKKEAASATVTAGK